MILKTFIIGWLVGAVLIHAIVLLSALMRREEDDREFDRPLSA